jgi:hypothetical protein
MTTRDYRTAKDLFGDGVPEKAPRSRGVGPPRPPPKRMRGSLAESRALGKTTINQEARNSNTANYRSPLTSARARRVAMRFWRP